MRDACEQLHGQFESAVQRGLEEIRNEVADLTLEAVSRVVGRTLDAKRDRELISEAVDGLDFSRLEESA